MSLVDLVLFVKQVWVLHVFTRSGGITIPFENPVKKGFCLKDNEVLYFKLTVLFDFASSVHSHAHIFYSVCIHLWLHYKRDGYTNNFD